MPREPEQNTNHSLHAPSLSVCSGGRPIKPSGSSMGTAMRRRISVALGGSKLILETMTSGVYIRTNPNHWLGRKHSEDSKKKMRIARLGGAATTKTHGLSGTPTYGTWFSMKVRCLNKNSEKYRHYGGRGIKVCERWLSFENFFEDMGIRPKGKTLDRVDVNGHYEKKNCRWATQSEQMLNTRKQADAVDNHPIDKKQEVI